MIPKVIHYCWFGGAELPSLAKKCIASWEKHCPDYEIKEWNESSYDISSKPLYVQQAYAQKKWAFVSDYARFDILYQYGGVYFDTDVEIIRPIDNVINNGAFMGCETSLTVDAIDVNPGLGMAAEKGMSLYREVLDSYKSEEFDYSPVGNKTKTIVDRTTEILKKHGLHNSQEIQQVEDIWIYPSEYFCPFDFRLRKMKKTKNTYTIHWYDASWFSEQQKKDYRKRVKKKRIEGFKKRIKDFVGETSYEKMKKLIH